LPVGKAGEFSALRGAVPPDAQGPAGAPGVLSTLDLTPTLKATTLLLGYSLPW
jgi:hypothetical protein